MSSTVLSSRRPSWGKIWWTAARPKTLTAALVPVAVGTALAYQKIGSDLSWFLATCALVGALCIQIATNLINDAVDFQKGTDTAERHGPLRVTAAGWVTPQQVLVVAVGTLALAFFCGIPLIQAAGWPLVLIGLASLFLAYGYTAGPWPLAYLGLGDLFVILFFGVIAVGGTFFVLTGSWGIEALVMGACVGLLSTALLAVNNLRDRPGDLIAGKKTLAVRWGENFARAEVVACVMIPIFWNALFWMGRGYLVVAFLPCCALPLAGKVVRIVRRSEGTALNAALGASAGLHLIFGLSVVAALLWKA